MWVIALIFAAIITVNLIMANKQRSLMRWLYSDEPKVYYAHSKQLQRTPRELHELTAIKAYFTGLSVVNPAIIPQAELHNHLRAVQKSRALVFSVYDGHVGKGVFDEVQCALRCGIPVYVIEGTHISEWRGDFKVLGRDWKVRYAVPIVSKTNART